MPGSLSVRNLDDGLILSLKRRAARHGHSAEAEVRDILRQALAQEAEAGFDDLAAEPVVVGERHAAGDRQLMRPHRAPPAHFLGRVLHKALRQ